ncbi:endo-1,4-beta-xylanase [Streptomyces sp. NPDC014882]|uniref:endo-1,4-beta-xylanase n=1 Tax=Streptomyces sp. NPDC014882 TaxID=3364927 RepID=UPI003701E849
MATGRLGDGTCTALPDRGFTSVTPGTEMKRDATGPSRGSFDLGPADRIVDAVRRWSGRPGGSEGSAGWAPAR